MRLLFKGGLYLRAPCIRDFTVPEYKVNDETLPKIRVFRDSLGIRWIRSVLSELHLPLYFIDHSGVKCILDKNYNSVGLTAVNLHPRLKRNAREGL